MFETMHAFAPVWAMMQPHMTPMYHCSKAERKCQTVCVTDNINLYTGLVQRAAIQGFGVITSRVPLQQ